MIPTEHEGTVAVDAAARALHDSYRRQAEAQGVPAPVAYDDIPTFGQNQYREQVLNLVWAALESLPDRAAAERERIAAQIEAVDPVEWALAGEHAGTEAAKIARGEKP